MKKVILKAVAMPPRLFFAPMELAVVNIGLFLALIQVSGFDLNPLWFVLMLLAVHFFIVVLGKREPHLSKLLAIKGKKQQILCDKYDYNNATMMFKDNTFVCAFKMNKDLAYSENRTKFAKDICEKNTIIRFFDSADGNRYLIVSGKKGEGLSLSQVIQVVLASFPSSEILKTSTQTTPADVLKLILNPINEHVSFTDFSLNEKKFLTNKRSQIKKDVMCFEQKGEKLYTSVLCLTGLDDEIDLEFTDLLNDSNVSSLSWYKLLPHRNQILLLFQRKRMASLTSKSAAEQYTMAMDMASGGDAFYFYGLNIYVSATSERDLEMKKRVIIENAKRYGLHLVPEKWNLPVAFYDGFPQYEPPRQFLLPASVLFE